MSYVRYFLATFTPDLARDFVTGKLLPIGIPHLFNKFGLSGQSSDISISRLCASLSTPGHFLCFLTPPLHWARRRWIQRIDLIYACNVAGGTLPEIELIDAAVVHERPPSAPDVGAHHRLQATYDAWRYNVSINADHPLIRSIQQGGRVGIWVNVTAGAKVSIFLVYMKIIFSN
jgi:hypothetical protein